MKEDFITLLFLSFLFLLLFIISETLYYRFKVKVELTRKFVHVGTGLLTLLFPLFLSNEWSVFFICSVFFVLLIGTLKYKLLQSVNAIQRESVGGLAYPVAVSVTFWAFNAVGKQYIFYYVPILILAFCDPIAALVGKNFPYKKYVIGSAHKTLSGSLAFFGSACLVYFSITIFLGMNIDKYLIIKCLLVATTTTIAEAISGKGFDNISIPFAALLALMI